MVLIYNCITYYYLFRPVVKKLWWLEKRAIFSRFCRVWVGPTVGEKRLLLAPRQHQNLSLPAGFSHESKLKKGIN